MKRYLALWARLGLLPALLVFLPLAAAAQTAPNWSVGDPLAKGAMVALDRSNNSYLAGSVAAGPIRLTKLSPSGALSWQRDFASAGLSAKSTWVTVDAADNAVVTGMITDAYGTPLGPVVLKVDPAGNLTWQDVTSAMYGHAMRAETDATGNVYVLSRMAVLSGTSLVGMDMQLTKYSPAGVRQWTRSYGASSATSDSIVVTSAGKVVVSGRSSSLSDQVQLAAFDAAGSPVWAKGIATGADLGLAVGPVGELYAVGAPPSTQGLGFLVVKHDPNFNELWRNTYAARGYAHRAAVDAAGNLVVSGVVDTNTGLLQVVMYDWMTLKLDPNGALLWSRLKGQNGANDVPYGLALGTDGSAYITGEGKPSTTTATLGSGGTATLKVAPDGSQAWIDVSAAASRGLGIKLGSDGGVWVVGESPQTVFRYPQNGLPNQPPVAMASASPSAGVAPLGVAFRSTGSADPDGAIASYAWDFGDGQSSTAANPLHSYAVGSYSARLTVTDTLGASSTSAPIAITANPAPTPAQPTALILAKAVVTEGTSTTATVTVSSSTGVTVALSSSNSNVASVPTKLVIPAGATSASFTVKTSNVKRDTVVTLGASANGATTTASLTVRNR